MFKKEIKELVECGEGYSVEFKKAPHSLAKEMAAFANSSGGIIYIGIDDDGQLFPVKLTNRLHAQITDEANNCDPPIHLDILQWEEIVKLVVPEGRDKPYQCREGFFIRSGSVSQKLKRDQILKFAIAETKFYFDQTEIHPCPVAGNCSKDALEQFFRQTGITLGENNVSLFKNLRVLANREGIPSFNNAGILVFSNKYEEYIPQSKITCVVFGTQERYQVADRKDFSATLAIMIDQAIQYIKRNIRIGYRISERGTREEVWEYPYEAVREAITNAVMHRDYYEMGSVVQIDIFPDRIEFTNPGGLLPGLTKDTFGKLSFQRNPLIADLLYRCGYGEKIGTGITRIKEAIRRAGLPPPEFILSDKFFKLVFFGKPSFARPDTRQMPLAEEIVSRLRLEGSLSAGEMASAFGVSQDTVLRSLSFLIESGRVVRIGRARGTRYILKK